MTLSPSHRLYGLGAVMLVALAICSRDFGSRGAPSFLVPLAIAGVAYLLAVREFLSTPVFPVRAVVIGLALAAVWHGLFLPLPPGADDDVHRYLWDGRVQRLGYSPYILVPGDPAVSALHTPETRTLNNPDVPSPYPAGAQLFFRAVTAIHESLRAFKIAFVVCDAAIVLLLLDLLRRRREGAHWVLAYAWNPLLATETAGSGHVDIVGALLLVVSFAALARRWRSLAALAFALAVAVKVLPIVLLPLYWKRIRLRDGALAAIVCGLLYIPFVRHGQSPVGSLATYVQSFRFNDPVFAALERLAAPPLVAAMAVAVGILTAIWLRTRSGPPLAEAWAWPMAASLLCAPVVYPWYLLWLLPFLRSASALPMMAWTVSILPTYYVWHLRTIGRPWAVPGWVMVLEYGAVAATAGVIGLRRVMRPAIPQCSTNEVRETAMAKPRRVALIRVVLFGVLILAASSCSEKKHSPVAEGIAKTYGLDSFGDVDAIRYTFNAEFPGVKLSRAWEWQPKTGQVSYEGKDKEGKPVKATYVRSQLNAQPANVKDDVDPGFVNDNYWLLFPFHAYWDTTADVQDKGAQKLPLGNGSAKLVSVKYPAEVGGYTPGDTWDLYVGNDNRVEQMFYHRGGAKKPSAVITTWEGYKKAGPLLVSTEHRGTADGRPVRIFFSNVAVKVKGSDAWVDAQ